jgi:hypothetical protein
VLQAYATLARRGSPGRLVGPTLRTRSLLARDIFANLACEDKTKYADLAATLTATGAPPLSALGTGQRRRWLLALARVLAAQNIDAADHRHALALFDAVFDRHGADQFGPEDQTVFAQLLFLSGEHARCAQLLVELRKLPEVVAHYLRCDLMNPFTADGKADIRGWLDLVNSPLVTAGLQPVRLREGNDLPFDRLRADAARSHDGPLVSVIMTAFQPDSSLESSVRSILDQTWRGIELILVDDDSGAKYRGEFEACAAVDPRVRVLRQPVNGGTYVARNAGIEAARGQFVTFQDSDDWSHPERIERQLEPLLADAGLVASRSLAVRAHGDLTHQWLGYAAQRLNASSLLFRREPVLEKLGYFDSVRKGADAEYAFRLEAAFGRRIHDVMQPLAYTRLRQSSLSRSDFVLGWSAPARIAHQGAYREWHREVAHGESPYLPRHPQRRPFPVPSSFLERVPGAPTPTRHYDVVFLDDWQSHSGPREGGLEEATILAERGLRVGLVHLEAIGRMTAARQHVDLQVQQAVSLGSVDRVLLDEDVSTALLIVRDPMALQFAPTSRAAFHADRVVIMITRAVSDYPGLSLAFDLDACTQNAKAIFGVTPRWRSVHEELSEAPAAAVIAPPVDPDRWFARRSRHRCGRPPVLGRYDADSALSWPSDPTVLRQVYPSSERVDVRILGQVDIALRRLERTVAPPSWLVYSRSQLTLRAFLHQLDFFVFFPNDALGFPPLDMLARAMASGTVILAPERFRGVLADAAVYCAPETVTTTARRYHADPELYSRQVALGNAFVAHRHHPDDYVKRIEDMINSPIT